MAVKPAHPGLPSTASTSDPALGHHDWVSGTASPPRVLLTQLSVLSGARSAAAAASARAGVGSGQPLGRRRGGRAGCQNVAGLGDSHSGLGQVTERIFEASPGTHSPPELEPTPSRPAQTVPLRHRAHTAHAVLTQPLHPFTQPTRCSHSRSTRSHSPRRAHTAAPPAHTAHAVPTQPLHPFTQPAPCPHSRPRRCAEPRALCRATRAVPSRGSCASPEP
jgi:hypothetical protein